MMVMFGVTLKKERKYQFNIIKVNEIFYFIYDNGKIKFKAEI